MCSDCQGRCFFHFCALSLSLTLSLVSRSSPKAKLALAACFACHPPHHALGELAFFAVLMIKSKTLRALLEQACTGGVQATILLDLNGSMIAYSGGDVIGNQMVTAIVANLWTSFQSKEPGLVTLLFDFEKGRVAASRTSQFVLCVCGAETVPLGLLKAKAETLADYLQSPMDEVCAAQGGVVK